MIPKQLQNPEFRFCLIRKQSKAPFEKEWQKNGYQWDNPKLQKHLENNQNYGVIGGYGNLRILDKDKKELNIDLDTFCVQTGSGGKHYYFLSDYNINHVFADDLGELRSDNYQVVGAGSIHPNLKSYKVYKNLPLKNISSEEVLKLIEPYLKKEKIISGKWNKPEEEIKLSQKFNEILEANEKIKKLYHGDFEGYDLSIGGELALVCFLIQQDLNKKEIFNIMATAKIGRWAERGVSYRNQTYKKALAKITEKKKEKRDPSIFFSHDKKGKMKSFIPKLLGDYIKENFYFKTIRGNDKQIYFYQNGYYKENGISLIKDHATASLGSLFKEYYINEVISYIRNTTYTDVDKINHNWINLKNGLLNPITREFKPHTPDIFCLYQSPINYIPKEDCPIFQQKLKEKCDEDWKFKAIQEMFGNCFLHDNRFEKAYLLYGDPRTMKSTTLYLLEKLLGKKSIQSMSLQQLMDDPFAPAWLFGVSANICADLSSSELKNTAMFMKIVGQDSITAGKKFQDQITFTPFTKLIFSCNIIPATRNKNMAFYRRWCLIEFNIQTKESEVDPLMREKLDQELSGILNWALEGMDRILKNNKLTFPLSDTDVKDLYEKGSDSVQSFIYHMIDCEDDEGVIKKRDVYNRYMEFCKINKLNIDNQVFFGRRFFAITGCGSKRVGVIPGYAGVSFKDMEEKQRKIL